MGKFKGVVTKRATAETLLLRQASAGIGLCSSWPGTWPNHVTWPLVG